MHMSGWEWRWRIRTIMRRRSTSIRLRCVLIRRFGTSTTGWVISQVELKKYDEAIASYLKERERSGDDAGLEEALADAYQAKGMQQQAQDARNKAAQLNGQNTD